MKHFKFILPFILSLILVFNFSHHTYAAVGDVLTAYEILNDDDFSFERVLNRFGIVVTNPRGIAAHFINYIDNLYGFGGGGYSRGEDWVNDTVDVGSDGQLIFSDQFNEVFINFLKEYVQDNSLSYSYQRIYSYKNVSSTFFVDQVQYNAFLDYVSGIENDYIVVPNISSTGVGALCVTEQYPSGTYKNQVKIILTYSDPLTWYLSDGHSSDYIYHTTFEPSSNWVNVNPYNKSKKSWTDGWSAVAIMPDGTIYEALGYSNNTSANRLPTFNLGNTNYTFNSSCDAIFTTLENNVTIFAFDSLEAIGIHNTGEPQPYYLGSNFGNNPGAFVINSPLSSNTFNPYNEIINNISPGMSAGDLQNIVNISISNSDSGSGSGGGSDSGDKDNDSLWDKIKDGVVGFFEELAEVIKEVVSLIVDTLLGALRELLSAVKDILTEMVNFFIGEKDPDNPGKRLDNGFVSLMTSFFDWLPAPLPLVIKSIFIIAIVFALIKMVKGFAS